MNSPETAGRDIIPFRNAKKSKKGGTQQVPEDSNISLEIYRKRISAMKELFPSVLITINPDQNWRAPKRNKRINFKGIQWELVAENDKVEYFVPLRNLLQENPNKIISEYKPKLETSLDPIVLGMSIIGEFRDLIYRK